MKHLFLQGEKNIAKSPDIRAKISAAKYLGKTFTCKTCGIIKPCSPYQLKTKKYCSRACKSKWMSSQEKENTPRWKGGLYVNREGYREIRKNKNSILEHRYIMEKYINRKLTEEEVIHHINGNKQDNRIDNLIIVTRSEHMLIHNTFRLRNALGQFI